MRDLGSFFFFFFFLGGNENDVIKRHGFQKRKILIKAKIRDRFFPKKGQPPARDTTLPEKKKKKKKKKKISFFWPNHIFSLLFFLKIKNKNKNKKKKKRIHSSPACKALRHLLAPHPHGCAHDGLGIFQHLYPLDHDFQWAFPTTYESTPGGWTVALKSNSRTPRGPVLTDLQDEKLDTTKGPTDRSDGRLGRCTTYLLGGGRERMGASCALRWSLLNSAWKLALLKSRTFSFLGVSLLCLVFPFPPSSPKSLSKSDMDKEKNKIK